MKGHMQDGKFHPHTEYKKGVRKSRDLKAKTKGVRMKREPQGSTVFSGMGLFDFANKIGKWEGQMGYRGMMDVWEHKKTGDTIVIEPYEDTPPERMGKDFEGEEEVWVHDKDTGNHDSLFIGSPSEALSFANMWMRENKEGWE